MRVRVRTAQAWQMPPWSRSCTPRFGYRSAHGITGGGVGLVVFPATSTFGNLGSIRTGGLLDSLGHTWLGMSRSRSVALH